MSRTTRGGLLLVLCLIVVASLVLTGCGSKKEKALQQPSLEFTSYNKGSTVDFDDATLNSMADGGGEAAFKYNIMKAIYPTIWNSNKDAVAQALFPAPYWRGDGVHTYYSYLISADQTAVDGTIFATKLSAAEQQIVLNSVESFFALYDDEIAAAKPLQQNTAYDDTVLQGVGRPPQPPGQTEATAWMAALNAYATAHYSGKTYAQLTYIERKTVEGIVFANGAGTINPEYSFWRTMVKTSFRNGNASARYPDVRERGRLRCIREDLCALDCVEKPTVDGAVWAALTAGQQTNVTRRRSPACSTCRRNRSTVSLLTTRTSTTSTLRSGLSDNLTTDNSAATAAADWLTAVNRTTPGTSENTSFYAELLYGQRNGRTMLAYKYFGTDNYTDCQLPPRRWLTSQTWACVRFPLLRDRRPCP